MKVIIAGATGFIGHAVLRHCISDDRITAIVALVRRALPAEWIQNTTKVRTLIPRDWEHISEKELEVLRGAEACVWSIGLTPKKLHDLDLGRKTDFDYPLAMARLAAQKLQPALTQPFRFIYLSAFMAKQDQQRNLWLVPEARRLKGLSEVALLELAKEHSSQLDLYIIKTAKVYAMWNPILPFMPSNLTISEEAMGIAITHVAVQGDPERILTNAYMNAMGTRLLRERQG